MLGKLCETALDFICHILCLCIAIKLATMANVCALLLAALHACRRGCASQWQRSSRLSCGDIWRCRHRVCHKIICFLPWAVENSRVNACTIHKGDRIRLQQDRCC